MADSVRAMIPSDWPQVAAIWAEGIATGNATFERTPCSWPRFEATRPPHLRLVAERVRTHPADARRSLLGWVAAGPVSRRSAYSGVVENSLYVSAAARRQGVGRGLLDGLIAACESTGVWTIRSGVFPENRASLDLHAVCGFRQVGVQERVGRRDGRWRDVVQLERRSRVVGDDGPLIRLGDSADEQAIGDLLSRAGLSVAGLDDAWRSWVADADPVSGPIVAAAALERYAATFLLRSVVVDAAHRGAGLGTRLVRAALTGADLQAGGRAQVCLLTQTADGWFDRFGFSAVERSSLPAEVSASAQLRGSCPASARAYFRRGT